MIKRERKRNKQLVIRLSEEEYSRVKNKVDSSGLSQREYITRCLMNKKIVQYDRKLIREIIIQLNSIGNNLNQIAKVANAQKFVSKDGFDKIDGLKIEMSNVWKSVDSIIK